MEPIPLILDVDTGVDDALAILYALASPEVTFGCGLNAVAAPVVRSRPAMRVRAEPPAVPNCPVT